MENGETRLQQTEISTVIDIQESDSDFEGSKQMERSNDDAVTDIKVEGPDSVLEASENIERIDDDAVIDIIEVEDPGSELEASEQMERRDEDAVIDVGDPYLELETYLMNELESLHPLSEKCTIHCVQENVRRLDEKAYTPRIVSIGPIHHGKLELKAMEEYKRRYLQQFLERTNQLKEKPEILTTPTVKELYQAGVKFKLGLSKNLFDIRFHNGILEIPRFTVVSSLENVWKNLLAFEHSQCDDDLLNDYIIIMNYLVNTPKDVDILVQHQIIQNPVGDCELVSSLLHRLNQRPVFSSRFLYSSLVEELNEYCRRPSHRWKATLKQDYFKTPWTTVSVIAATILLILTVIQTICSILQVK
ncbi:hypothetical protein Patl1_29647 [Pistacia atlantica]|uniref:Uncharacterized protein n=1 Tax=Pistacia atlantica TaxID=434234 RepID=A0ACC1AE45_9ROSI|nr:hypothetical protein Patl1_29647 [Pistacia atlantica]